MSKAYRFELEHVCAQTGARAGRIHTARGVIETPIFMPVGTQGAIKGGVLPRDLREIGAQIILGNTYHLRIRPGPERIAEAGGLQTFTNWRGPMLTDSGGFQVFSLGHQAKITDEGVVFRSHVDGEKIRLDAEEAVRIQELFGSDIMMAFDQCPPAGAERRVAERAMRRTTAWLDRCIAARRRSDEVALYGIVQGGIDAELRTRHVEEICARDACEGFAIGGLSVGESTDITYEICAHTAAQMPRDKARYLMGVGTVEDLVHCIGYGIDQFDCVLPSRNARHGNVYTADGPMRIKNSRFATDDRPLDPDCVCPACRGFSRSLIRHLWVSGEVTAGLLMTLHNLAFFLRLVRDARAAILADRYGDWQRETLARYGSKRWREGVQSQQPARGGGA